MSSIVQELQRECLNGASVTDLLRKAYVVARKLRVNDFEDWLNKELRGYGKISHNELPLYRHIRGELKVFNPYHGYQPVMFPNEEVKNQVATRSTAQSIPELEDLIKEAGDRGIHVALQSEVEAELMASFAVQLRPTIHVSPASLKHVIEVVKTIILEWSLKLEDDGILGEGISFSTEEITKAKHVNYMVTNFQGDIMNSQVQIATESSAQEKL